ncbi:DUF3375 family protein [Pengzhenrongella frigida]|uniref:DUF3375 family protein n=1 Tax=Pengzhenrongella frigida TaxID=1259133 RepID=A0A4Q5N1T9_9MICO|nr:DUF3375 family protein [Cellulomonas sp. HLT2-17]RYV52098.1 DUF3375 family protein [Cellulomonas sp. HLT2-17]
MAQHQTRALSRLAGFERASARPEMTLLRAHNLEWIMSILAEHLAHGPVEVSRFHEIVDLEIQDMRSATAGPAETARTGREYCNEWVTRQWINRALVERVEQYTLTASTLDVLAFTDRLVDHRSTVSESRLKQILDSVSRLAGDANPDPRARIERIDAQIAALQSQRDLQLSGTAALPSGSALHEQLNNIMDLSRHLPADFKRVSDSVYEMHRRFVGDAQEGPVSRGEALRSFFAEHDLLETSDEGKAFRGLMRLWGNHREQTALRRDIDDLLRQDFAAGLTVEQRRALRALPRVLVDCAEEVQETYRRLTQSLERYVQSQNSSDRDLRSRLGRAQAAAHALFDRRTHRSSVDLQIGATMARVRSISQLQLIDPRLHESPAALEPDRLALVGALTPVQMRELGGPALEEIRLGVELAAGQSESGRPTLREVWLALSPELRRPKNVVGLLHVAVEQGAVFIEPVTERLETLRPDGSTMVHTVPAAVFPDRREATPGVPPAEKPEVRP